ncbi:hypothetical protein GJ744_002540 [Endocarpon pusillum]|uniref:Uncharacterized protein n=1 Tax=Endocarpon pusillum TaxID=364733 RepID=A0A8H7A8Q7_9EURO|nr:hypothetical protein GJ744_002540 [Endocarpon pusillum]
MGQPLDVDLNWLGEGGSIAQLGAQRASQSDRNIGDGRKTIQQNVIALYTLLNVMRVKTASKKKCMIEEVEYWGSGHCPVHPPLKKFTLN